MAQRGTWTVVRNPDDRRHGNGWRFVTARSARAAAVVTIGSRGVRVRPDGLVVSVWPGELPTTVGAGDPVLRVALLPGRYTGAEVRAAVRPGRYRGAKVRAEVRAAPRSESPASDERWVYAYAVYATMRGKRAGVVSGPHSTREIARQYAAEAMRAGAPGVHVVRVHVTEARVAPDGRRFPIVAQKDGS